MANLTDTMTPPEIARLLNVQLWKVRKAVDVLGVGVRAGFYRVVPRSDLPAIRRYIRTIPTRRKAAAM
jgi:hypothetical protein